MANQDYQSSKWTNGEYTIEWASERDVLISVVRPKSGGICYSSIISNELFSATLCRIIFPEVSNAPR